MAKAPKKEAGKESGRGGTSPSQAKKVAKPKATKRARPKKVAQPVQPARPTTRTRNTKTKEPATAVLTTSDCPRPAPLAEPTEPFISEGKPQPGGRLTVITRAQALGLLPAEHAAARLGDAQNFIVVEWSGRDLPEGIPINGHELKDLDPYEGATSTTDEKIGECELLDSPGDEGLPEYMAALIWF